MKAISLIQPWAMCVSLGLKCYDTRSWKTTYRGPLLIHASQKKSAEARAQYEQICQLLGPHDDLPDFDLLPRGVILCRVDLLSIRPAEELACSDELSILERSLGDYSAGRFAWQFAVRERCKPPVPAKGGSGLWEFNGRGLGRSSVLRGSMPRGT